MAAIQNPTGVRSRDESRSSHPGALRGSAGGAAGRTAGALRLVAAFVPPAPRVLRFAIGKGYSATG